VEDNYSIDGLRRDLVVNVAIRRSNGSSAVGYALGWRHS